MEWALLIVGGAMVGHGLHPIGTTKFFIGFIGYIMALIGMSM
jgi:hypothetical protein